MICSFSPKHCLLTNSKAVYEVHLLFSLLSLIGIGARAFSYQAPLLWNQFRIRIPSPTTAFLFVQYVQGAHDTSQVGRAGWTCCYRSMWGWTGRCVAFPSLWNAKRNVGLLDRDSCFGMRIIKALLCFLRLTLRRHILLFFGVYTFNWVTNWKGLQSLMFRKLFSFFMLSIAAAQLTLSAWSTLSCKLKTHILLCLGALYVHNLCVNVICIQISN